MHPAIRNTLATAALSLLASGAAFANPANLVINGSFEDISSAPGIQHLGNGSWSVFSSIPGWTTTSGAGIEVRRNVAGTAENGVQFVELDSHSYRPGKPASFMSNSTMTQTIATVANQRYELSFWYSPRPHTGDTNDIRVLWDGQQLGGILAGTNNAGTHHWTRYSYTVFGHGLDALSFSAVGRQDTYGGSLDNVSLISAVPESQPMAMMLAGLGMLACVVRRRKLADA